MKQSRRKNLECRPRILCGPFQICVQFDDLGIVDPDHAVTGVENELAHIVDISTLIGSAKKFKLDGELPIPIGKELTVCLPDFPLDYFLRLFGVPWGVDLAILVHGESGTLLRKRLAGNDDIDEYESIWHVI